MKGGGLIMGIDFAPREAVTLEVEELEHPARASVTMTGTAARRDRLDRAAPPDLNERIYHTHREGANDHFSHRQGVPPASVPDGCVLL
jgi:hypothetical protein